MGTRYDYVTECMTPFKNSAFSSSLSFDADYVVTKIPFESPGIYSVCIHMYAYATFSL